MFVIVARSTLGVGLVPGIARSVLPPRHARRHCTRSPPSSSVPKFAANTSPCETRRLKWESRRLRQFLPPPLTSPASPPSRCRHGNASGSHLLYLADGAEGLIPPSPEPLRQSKTIPCQRRES